MAPMFASPPRWISGDPGRSARELWWLNPLGIVLAILVPVYLSFLAFDYRQMVPNDYVPSALYVWGLSLLLVLAAGLAFGASIALPSRAGTVVYVPTWLPLLLLTGTLVAYVVWFHPLALRPQLILEVLRGERLNVRDVVSTMPPLTTLSQWGAAYAIVHAIRRGEGRTAGWERAGLWLVLLFALLRSIVWSERLALIEVVVCYAVARLAYYRLSGTGFRAAGWLPVVAPIALYLAFVATESVRSWTFYQNYYDSIWSFALERLSAYYALAINNGIGWLTESLRWPTYDGSYVLEWAHPSPDGQVSAFQLSPSRHDYRQFLANFARPEFNNPSGLFPIVYDVGYFGSALYFLAVGMLIGIAYRAFHQRLLGGVLFYPLCVLFLAELLRFNYVSASRSLPIVMALALTYFASHRLRRVWAPRFQGGRS